MRLPPEVVEKEVKTRVAMQTVLCVVEWVLAGGAFACGRQREGVILGGGARSGSLLPMSAVRTEE